jgi:hypothetical protein
LIADITNFSTLFALIVSSLAALLSASHALAEFHDIIIPSALWLGMV